MNPITSVAAITSLSGLGVSPWGATGAELGLATPAVPLASTAPIAPIALPASVALARAGASNQVDAALMRSTQTAAAGTPASPLQTFAQVQLSATPSNDPNPSGDHLDVWA